MSVGIMPAHLARNWMLPANKVNTHGATGAPGYSLADLSDGTLGRAWRSDPAFGTSAYRFTLTLPAAAKVSFMAALDVRAYSTSAKISQVRFGVGTWSAVAIPLATAVPRRGDAGVRFTPQTSATWWVEVWLTGSAPISIGEIVIGEPLEMATHFRAWQRDDQKATIRNGDFASRAAARRMSLSCEWAALKAADHAQMLDLIDPLEGALHPVVLIPDLDAPGELYHGTLDDSHPHAQGPDRYHTGHRIVFTESRRPLGY
ncbi:MAG TPA: hypothetical protein VGD74_01130 [Vulgatibacter sp.]